MAYLHSDREQFRDAIDLAYEQTGVMVQAIEKDYYVTMLLRLLAQKMPYIVFKGGTSLSKCHKVIRRFSEDIEQGVPFVALPVFPGDVVPLFPSGTASFPIGFPRPCFLSLGCRACHRDGPDREVSCRKQCSGRSGGADSLGRISNLRHPVLFG